MNPYKDIQVLVVEDEPLVTEMIRGVLKKLRYAVIGEAASGKQAIEMTRVLQPDVILMDIQMPDMDGLEATLRIYECCPAPVVILTAHDSPELIVQASEVGVGAYLLKPPNARELERAITIAVARFGDMMQLRHLNAELEARNQELLEALAKVKTLSGLLPICANCKKIRDDSGYWQQVEIYIQSHVEVEFSHGICPDCMKKLYPEFYEGE
jgi:DNA-binding NarL/FixJ family response regulator